MKANKRWLLSLPKHLEKGKKWANFKVDELVDARGEEDTSAERDVRIEVNAREEEVRIRINFHLDFESLYDQFAQSNALIEQLKLSNALLNLM